MNIIDKLQNYSRALVIAAMIFAGFGLAMLPTTSSYADAQEDVCGAIGGTGASGDCKVKGSTSVEKVIKTVINILSLLGGVIAVIMIIVGGLKYITSAGDSNGMSSARNTILYAVVGLIIIALAQVIVQFVLNKT